MSDNTSKRPNQAKMAGAEMAVTIACRNHRPENPAEAGIMVGILLSAAAEVAGAALELPWSEAQIERLARAAREGLTQAMRIERGGQDR